MSEAWHIMHGRDVSGEEARGSQGIRTRGGEGTLQIAQPSEDLTSIAADIMFSDPSKSRRDEAVGPPLTSETHLLFPNLPSTTHISFEYVTTDNEDYGNERDPEGRHVHRSIRNYVNSLYLTSREEPDTAVQPAPDCEGTDYKATSQGNSSAPVRRPHPAPQPVAPTRGGPPPPWAPPPRCPLPRRTPIGPLPAPCWKSPACPPIPMPAGPARPGRCVTPGALALPGLPAASL